MYAKQSSAALAPSSLLIFPPLHLPFISSSTQLLHLAFSFCYPLDATQALLQADVTGSEARKRQTASGWSVEFTAPARLHEQLHNEESWHLCLPATQRCRLHRGLNFSLPSFHATMKYGCCFAPQEEVIVKFKFCSIFSSLAAYSTPWWQTKTFSCSSPVEMYFMTLLNNECRVLH